MKISTALAGACWVAACFIATSFITATANAGEVNAALKKYDLNIPRQTLDTAIKDLAQQTGLQIARMSDAVDGTAMVGPINGSLTKEQALSNLLSAQGLTYKIINDRTIAIVKPGDEIAYLPQAESLGSGLRLASSESKSQETGSSDSVSSEGKTATDVQRSQDSSDTVQEIVVTAQKREQRIEDIPMSVSALSAEEMALRGIRNAQDLSFAVPGLTVVDQGGGQQNIMIRGISSIRGTSSLVGMYLDEVPVSGAQDGFLAAYADLRTFDLERVEVLKGPQGTLFGEGAIGGVLRYVTKDPQLDAVGGELSGTFYGNSGSSGMSEEVSGVLNVPIAKDVFGIRIAANYEDAAGWIDQPALGKKDINGNQVRDIRVKALWRPTEKLALKALFAAHRNDGGASNIVNLRPYDASQFQQAFSTGEPTDYWDRYEIYNLTATYDLGFAQFLSSSSYYAGDGVFSMTQLAFDDTGTSSAEIWFYHGRRPTIASQEFRLTSTGTGPFKWVVGGQYKKSRVHRYIPIESGGLDLRLGNGAFVLQDFYAGFTQINDSKAWAGFADASYTFMDRLEIGGGLRSYRDESSGTNYVYAVVSPETDSGNFDAVTYRAFVRYAATDGINLYANVGTGFRGGGFNPATVVAAGFPGTYDPEKSIFYEAGVKTKLADGKVGFDVAAFKGKYTDQIEDAIEMKNGNVYQFAVNSGEAEIEGFEWQLDWAPVRSLRLSFAGEKIDTEVTTVKSLSSPYKVGDPLTAIPDYRLIVTGNYRFNWTANAPGYVDVSFNRLGPSYATYRTVVPPQDHAPGVDLLQASLGAQWGDYQFSLFGRNLLDERNPLSPSVYGVTPQARPRTFGVSVSRSF